MGKNVKAKHMNASELQNMSEKQKEKRKTIAIIALIVITAIVGVYAMFTLLERTAHRDPGYYRLEAPLNDSAPLYAHDYSFEHYFEGESFEIKSAADKCSGVYGGILLRIYKLTDAKNLYDDCKNIAYLNAHKGEEVELEKELFDILVSAYKLTQAGRFNLFAGALNSTWNDIIYSDAPWEFDPLVNEEQRMRILNAVESAQNLDQFSFEIVDEQKHIVKFNASTEHSAFSETAELGETVLDLGILRHAFVVDTVCSLMEQAGYDNGYMTSTGGASRALSKMNAEGYSYAAVRPGNGCMQAFSFPVQPNSAYCTLRSFGLEGELGYYTLAVTDGERLRSPNYSLKTGEVYDNLLTACAFADSGGAVDACLAAYSLISASSVSADGDPSSLADGNSVNNSAVAFILKDESSIIYVSTDLAERITANEDGNYSVVPLKDGAPRIE